MKITARKWFLKQFTFLLRFTCTLGKMCEQTAAPTLFVAPLPTTYLHGSYMWMCVSVLCEPLVM